MTSTAETIPVAPARRARTRRRMDVGLLKYLLLALFVVIVLLPLYILVVTSFKGVGEIDPSRAWSLPHIWTIDGWRQAWNGQYALLPYLKNSFKLVIPATVLSCLLGSLNGFVLSKWRFPGADFVFTFFLFGMFIPYQAIMIPLTQLFGDVNFPEGIPRLIFAHVIYGIPITTLIFRNYYVAIPEELVEASKVDGASFFGIYRHILLPLSVPGFVVVLIWQFTSAWNDFLFGSLLARQANWPITVAVNNLAGSFQVAWNVQMAGALIAAIPTLLIYVLLGRFFMRGLLAGSLKG